MKKIIFLLPIVIALTACGTQVQNQDSSTSTSVNTNSSTIVETTGSGMASSSGTKTPEVTPEQMASSIESIKKINSLDDLKKMNPLLASLGENNHPKFLELQKTSMTFGVLLSQIKNPEYLKLLEEKNDILLGKEMWNKEAKSANEAFMIALKQQAETPEEVEAIQAISLKNTQAMQKIQSDPKYQDYIKSNQEKIAQLDAAIQKLYTPEIIAVQNKIKELSAEVYQNQKGPVIQ